MHPPPPPLWSARTRKSIFPLFFTIFFLNSQCWSPELNSSKTSWRIETCQNLVRNLWRTVEQVVKVWLWLIALPSPNVWTVRQQCQTNHRFSERSGHDHWPLTNHPHRPIRPIRPTKPNQKPPNLTISSLYDVLHYTNQIFSENSWHTLTTHCVAGEVSTPIRVETTPVTQCTCHVLNNPSYTQLQIGEKFVMIWEMYCSSATIISDDNIEEILRW